MIQHIGFLSINLHSLSNRSEALVGLREILINILKEERIKKLELFTVEPAIADLCKNAGFFVRGEKIASYCDSEGFKNELGVEYSFFNIADAKKIIIAKIADSVKRNNIDESLSKCFGTIQSLLHDNTCDILAARYLENMVYQIVRDSLGPNKIFSLEDKRWMPLLHQCPTALHSDLLRLYNRLQSSVSIFFKNDNPITIPEFPESNLHKLD